MGIKPRPRGEDVKLKILHFESKDMAVKAASPEGVIGIIETALFRQVGEYVCFPRPKVLAWNESERMPSDFLGKLHTSLYEANQPVFRAPPICPDKQSIEKSFKQGGDAVGDYFVWRIPLTSETNMHLYSVTDDNTEYVALYLTQEAIYFHRLGDRLFLALPDDLDRTFPFSIEARWTPATMRLGILYPMPNGSSKYASIEVDLEQLSVLPRRIVSALRSKTAVDLTPPTKFGIGDPRECYASKDDFFETAIETLGYIRRQLMKAKPSGYWNHDKKAKTSVPKDEPHCGDTLFTLMDSIFAFKNIDVSREPSSRSGDCDFGLSASLANHARVAALLELKKAHSLDLEHGLAKQLPKYVEEQQKDGGIYGVLWFKGENFKKPSDESLDACLERLKGNMPDTVVDIVGFDLSYKKSASKQG